MKNFEIKRTPKQSAEIVAKTIEEIVSTVKETKGTYKGHTFDTLVSRICEKHNINKNHIRTVGRWDSED